MEIDAKNIKTSPKYYIFLALSNLQSFSHMKSSTHCSRFKMSYFELNMYFEQIF